MNGTDVLVSNSKCYVGTNKLHSCILHHWPSWRWLLSLVFHGLFWDSLFPVAKCIHLIISCQHKLLTKFHEEDNVSFITQPMYHTSGRLQMMFISMWCQLATFSTRIILPSCSICYSIVMPCPWVPGTSGTFLVDQMVNSLPPSLRPLIQHLHS